MDAQLVSDEQNLVQPIYDDARKGGYLGEWAYIAGADDPATNIAKWGYGIKMKPFTGDISDVKERYRYGMDAMGYSAQQANPGTMPSPSTPSMWK